MRPFSYQDECVCEVEQFGGRALLACDPGLGKTAMTLWWLLRNNQASFPAVVVCPASVKYHWEEQVRRILEIEATTAEGRMPSRKVRFDILIINYDILSGWVDYIREAGVQTVVLDEIQYVANRTKRTKAAQAIVKGTPHVIGLSGTPLVNRPIELFNGLQMIRPSIFRSRLKYAERYCGPRWTPWGVKYSGATHTEELHRLLLDSCMVRRRKTEVLPDLPDKIRRVITLPMDHAAEYDRANEDFLNWLAEKDVKKANKAARAEGLTKTGYLLRLAARLKLRNAVEWINTFLQDTDEQLVVYCVHRAAARALERRCKATSVVVDGSLTGRRRQHAVDSFQGGALRLLIGNIRAAGVGITLTASSNVVFVELPWQPGVVVQAEDRIHRIGTKQEAWCWYLVAGGSIEEKLCGILQSKQQVLSSVLDGHPLQGDLDIYNQLMRSMAVHTPKTGRLGPQEGTGQSFRQGLVS